MTLMTKNGNPDTAPATRKSGGSAAAATSPMTAPIARLIHQGDRSRIANSDFSAIFSFKRHSPERTGQGRTEQAVYGLDRRCHIQRSVGPMAGRALTCVAGTLPTASSGPRSKLKT